MSKTVYASSWEWLLHSDGEDFVSFNVTCPYCGFEEADTLLVNNKEGSDMRGFETDYTCTWCDKEYTIRFE